MPLAELHFCPVEDLGLADYRGPRGREVVRTHCKAHFAGALARARRHEQKEERHGYERQLETRMNNLKARAAHKGLVMELDKATLRDTLFSLSATCFHCGDGTHGEYPLGTDRLDLTQGYTAANTVACCNRCNIARGNMTLDAFRTACRNIATFQTTGQPTVHKVPYVVSLAAAPLLSGVPFTSLKACAEQRGLQVQITEADHARLRMLPCYLCGVQDGDNGVDRRDNTQGYTHDNAFPCCTCCNMIKRTSGFEEIVAACIRVQKKSEAPGRS